MSQTQVLQGTWEELSAHAASLGDKLLTLVIPADKESLSEASYRQPEEVKTKERLEELLLEGLASPSHEMTDADWAELKQRAKNRAERKSR
jgi:hypothetical protein